MKRRAMPHSTLATLTRSLTRILLAAGAVALLAVPPAAAVTVEEVPSPRPAGWSVDLTGTLSPATRSELDALGERVHAASGGELVVVVVRSVDGADPREFAVRLFNEWGIGSRERDDGALIFMALADRAAEIVLGDGLDGPAGQRASDRAMDEEMVPRFRAGQVADGLHAGARLLAEALYGVAEEAGSAPAVAAPAPASVPVPRVELPPSARGPMPGRSPGGAFREPPPSPNARPSRRIPFLPQLLGLAVLAGLGGLAFVARRPSKCRACGVRRIKLDELSEDEHLEPVERLEEEIGSVDHQVWVCPSCRNVMEVSRSRWFSAYSTCSACGGRTWRTSERVVTYATTESEGVAQVDGWCASCDHRSSTTRILPRKIEWVDDDDSYHFSRSSSRSSSSTSASSSSSSGFGGGHSSGGGSSGRW